MATRVNEFINIEYKVKEPPKSKRRSGITTPNISSDNLINKKENKIENIKINYDKQQSQQEKSSIKIPLNENLKPRVAISKTPIVTKPAITPRSSNENKYNSNELSPNKILPSKVKPISISKRPDPHNKIPQDNYVKWIATGKLLNRDFLNIETDLEINRIKNENNSIQKPILSPRPSSSSQVRPKSGKCLRERTPHQTSGPVIRIKENKQMNGIHDEGWSKNIILYDPDERGKPQKNPLSDKGHESFQQLLIET